MQVTKPQNPRCPYAVMVLPLVKENKTEIYNRQLLKAKKKKKERDNLKHNSSQNKLSNY